VKRGLGSVTDWSRRQAVNMVIIEDVPTIDMEREHELAQMHREKQNSLGKMKKGIQHMKKGVQTGFQKARKTNREVSS
jgi:hypothetical protein